MKDIMLDLETLGTKPGCVVLSIGAIAFDAKHGELGDEFYEVIGIRSCERAGLKIDPKTQSWWQRQSDDAKQVLLLAGEELASSLARVLGRFDLFLAKQSPLDELQVWGNGSDFDQPILQACYTAIYSEAPWSYWNNRCYRTLKSFTPDLKIVRARGTHHNALDDARAQALHAISIYEKLGWSEKPSAPEPGSSLTRTKIERVSTEAAREALGYTPLKRS